MNIIIIGGGNLGQGLAKSLADENHNITVIDKDENLVDSIVDKFDVQGVVGGGTIKEVLLDAGAYKSDLVIATTNSDENNILSCFISKRLGTKHTIARVRNPEYTKQFNFMRNELGISMLLNPDLSTALEISRMIQFPSAMNIESFAGGLVDLSEVKVSTDSPIVNQKIGAISQRYKNKILICAVSRGKDVFIPNGDFEIFAGDKIYITSSHKYLGSIVKEINTSKKVASIKNVMLIGGSRISFYLANMLSNQGRNVTIIEKNYARCEEISEKINKNVTVICADANNHDALIEENIEKMDCVVTLTSEDEVNVLVSLFASSVNVPKNIIKLKNQDIEKMIENVFSDSTVNPVDTSVATVTQYIRAKKHASAGEMKMLYKLVGGKIEAAEFIVDIKTKYLSVPLHQINFKKDVLLASISRKNKFIVPGGNDTLEIDDRIIVVSKGKVIEKINDIFD